MPIVEEWEATGVRSLIGEGRTRPMRLSCKRGQVMRDFVVKTESNPETTPRSLFAEIAGNVMARRMGITTGDPALIRIDDQMSDVINEWMATRKDGYLVHARTAVGSAHVGGLEPIGPSVNLTAEEAEQALLIYTFDLLTQNPDRRCSRPNCARMGHRLFVYDFEMCFSFGLAVPGGPKPWQVSQIGISGNHVFRSALRGKARDLTKLRDTLPNVDGSWTDDLCRQLPESWAQYGKKTSDHISEALSNTDRFIGEVERSLA